MARWLLGWATLAWTWLGLGGAAVGQLGPLGTWKLDSPSAASSPQRPHPAVARIFAADRQGFSLGSGTLVATSDHHGLVVTNWHVVRDAAGPIVVAFPDGFRSPATVLAVDPEWDLAALAIWRPTVDPVPLASQPPRPGEPLTIAGYGSGPYRAVAGRCTQYLSPGWNRPFEIVELSAPARQGDSGGPIFNSRGELAGVLFGTAGGQTSGSYCGRVRAFLNSVRSDFFRLQPGPTALAQQPAAGSAPATTLASSTAVAQAAARSAGPEPGQGSLTSAPAGAPAAPGSWPAPPAAIAASAATPAATAPPSATTTLSAPMPPPAVAAGSTGPPDSLAATLWTDVRDYLAVIGTAAVALHLLKLLSSGSTAHQRAGRHAPSARR